MGLFDNVTGFFSGKTAEDAAQKQIAGLQAGYGQASDLLGQGRGAITSNYTAGLQPFMQNFGTATAGTGALTDALGSTGDPSQVQARFANTPGYQFQLEQGNENVLRNASRTGAGNSGAVNLDLQKQGQGLADSTYQQYVQNLMPFLGASGSAASGIGSLYSGLGSALGANYGTQAGAAYGTQAGIGNAGASAELAKNAGVGNLINMGTNAAKAISGFMAEGGRPPVGQPVVVGERGSELFVPDQPGTVVPHQYASTLMKFMGPQGADADQLARVSREYEPASADRAREMAAQRLRHGVVRGAPVMAGR